MSYSSIVPCTAVVRVQARLIIFTTCGTFTVYTTGQTPRCVKTSIRLPTMTLYITPHIVNIINLA